MNLELTYEEMKVLGRLVLQTVNNAEKNELPELSEILRKINVLFEMDNVIRG